MKKLLLGLLLLTVSSVSAFECEEFCVKPNGFYVGGFGGVNFKSDSDFNTGYNFSIAVGYRWCGQFRSELEYGYRHNEYKKHYYFDDYKIAAKSSVGTSSYMINTLWDIPFFNLGDFKPFIGGGIGYGHHKGHGSAHVESEELNSRARIKFSDGNFAWQIIAGIAYPVTDSVDLSAEYRLFKVNHSVYDNSIGMGLKYHF